MKKRKRENKGEKWDGKGEEKRGNYETYEVWISNSKIRIRKLWYIYTIEYNSAIKKNIFESVLMRWMKLELILQSEVSRK